MKLNLLALLLQVVYSTNRPHHRKIAPFAYPIPSSSQVYPVYVQTTPVTQPPPTYIQTTPSNPQPTQVYPQTTPVYVQTTTVYSQTTPPYSQPTPSYNQTAPSGGKAIVMYYAPWSKTEPEEISWKKITHVNYAFGVLYKKDSPAEITIDKFYDGPRIRKIQQLAKQNGVKALISIGGWTGSQTFSTVAKDSGLRQKFINNALNFLRSSGNGDSTDCFGLDGIDIDWEYPGGGGSENNAVDPNDSTNYLTLLKELRQAMDKEFPNEHKLLTAAVRVEPFTGPDGKPLSDVSAFANYFDFINIMIYDIMGPWSKTTGPNAPFQADTSKGGSPYSFVQAIDSWTNAKFPANKLTGGLAFYGHSVTAQVDMNATPDNIFVAKDSKTPKGDETDTNEANAINNEGTFFSGVWKYKNICKDILNTDGTAKGDWTRHWDQNTKTPWLFNSKTKVFLSYDDPQSIKIKADYAKQKNLAGLMVWQWGDDSNDQLLDQARTIF